MCDPFASGWVSFKKMSFEQVMKTKSDWHTVQVLGVLGTGGGI